jgi:hypothetical protein
VWCAFQSIRNLAVGILVARITFQLSQTIEQFVHEFLLLRSHHASPAIYCRHLCGLPDHVMEVVMWRRSAARLSWRGRRGAAASDYPTMRCSPNLMVANTTHNPPTPLINALAVWLQILDARLLIADGDVHQSLARPPVQRDEPCQSRYDFNGFCNPSRPKVQTALDSLSGREDHVCHP